MLIKIRHYGLPFVSSQDAILVATGSMHHIVLLRL